MRSRFLLGALLLVLLVAGLAVTWLVRAPQGSGVLPGVSAQQAVSTHGDDELLEPARAAEAAVVGDSRRAVEDRESAQVEQPAPRESESAALLVRAFDEDSGDPIAGARLFLWPVPVEPGFSIEGVDSSSASFGSSPVTDADGRARIDAPHGRPFRLTTGGEGDIRPKPISVDIEPLAPGEQRVLELQFTHVADLVFVGRVVDDENGAPLPNARLRVGRPEEIMDPLPERDSGRPVKVAAGSTGPFNGQTEFAVDGGAVFEFTVRSWERLVARVEVPGFAWVPVTLSTGHATLETAREVRLRRTAALEVTVRAGTGEALQDAHVEVSTDLRHLNRSSDFSEVVFWSEPVTWRGRTDALGRCLVEGLPPAVPLSVRARTKDHGEREWPSPISLAPGESRPFDLRFDDGVELRGWVRDAQGAGVVGAELWLLPREAAGGACLGEHERSKARVAHSERDGRFQFSRVAEGAWLVGCLPEGPYASQAQVVVVANGTVDREPVVIADGSLFIAGRVVGPGDEPAAAHLSVLGEDSGCYLSGGTGANGSFSIGPLTAGRYIVHVFRASSEQAGELTEIEPLRAMAGESGLVVRLARGVTLSGVVVDPVTGERTRSMVMASSESASLAWTWTGDEGSFEFDGLVPGRYTVVASTNDGRVARSPSVDLGSGGEARGLRLELTPGARLRVRYDGERPHGQVRVRLDGLCVAADGIERGTDITLVVPAGDLTVECSEYTGTQKSTRTREVSVAVGEMVSVDFGRDED